MLLRKLLNRLVRHILAPTFDNVGTAIVRKTWRAIRFRIAAPLRFPVTVSFGSGRGLVAQFLPDMRLCNLAPPTIPQTGARMLPRRGMHGGSERSAWKESAAIGPVFHLMSLARKECEFSHQGNVHG
jgi:hypothetical protein